MMFRILMLEQKMGKIYLFVEDVIISRVPDQYHDDPYGYYYGFDMLTNMTHHNQAPHFEDIESFCVGIYIYAMKYTIAPEENYDMLINSVGSPVSIIKHTGEEIF